jgi:hypothetical protein
LKSFSPPREKNRSRLAGAARFATAALWLGAVAFVGACAGRAPHAGEFEPADAATCRRVDSLLAGSGWAEPFEMNGRMTMDVEQYRVQGRFELDWDGHGGFTLRFTGTMLLGGRREDVVVALRGDTLRVLDRERGRYYEGAEVDALVKEGTELEWDLAEGIGRITARPMDCERLQRVSVRDGPNGGVSGWVDGAPFEVTFAGGYVRETVWPVMVAGRADDRMKVAYTWGEKTGGGRELRELIVFLEGRRWRVKLQAS